MYCVYIIHYKNTFNKDTNRSGEKALKIIDYLSLNRGYISLNKDVYRYTQISVKYRALHS